MSKNFRLDVTKAMAVSSTSMRSGSATTYQSASFLTAESGSVVNLYSPILIPAATASAFPTPNMGTGSLYVKASDYKIYFKTSYGTEYDLTSGGGGGGSPAGSNTQVQFNDGGSFGASANLTFDGTDLGVSAKIFHVGDTDTFINFTDDDINIQAGGVNFLDFTEDTQNEVTFNEAGVDIDFRVESADESHMLFIEGSTNRMSIGDNTGSPGATLEVKNNASAGAYNVPLVQLNSNDTDQIALDINASNIDANVVDILANAVTTAKVVDITANALTTGIGLSISSTSTDKSGDSELVKIHSDGDRGDDSNKHVGLLIDFDSTAGTAARALKIDSDQTTGKVVEVDACNITTGDGLYIEADDLTTGRGLYIKSDSSDTGAHYLASIRQDNSAAVESTGLKVQMDGGYQGIFVDQNYSDTTGQTTYGLKVDVDKTGASTSTNHIHGVFIDVDNTTATDGTNTMYGIKSSATLTHASDAGTAKVFGGWMYAGGGTNGAGTATGLYVASTGGDDNIGIHIKCVDGGDDLKMVSSADGDDLFKIQVEAAGKTTFTTVDDGGAEADIIFAPDGVVNVKDDIKLTFGDGEDAHIEYNEDGDDFMIVSGSAKGIAMSGSFVKINTSTDKGVLIAAGDAAVSTVTPGHGSSTPQLSFTGTGTPKNGIYAGDIDDDYDQLYVSGSYVQAMFGVQDSTNNFTVGHQNNLSILKVSAAGVIINDSSNAANDFRVESDDETHMLFVDSGNNRVSIGDSTDAPAATLEVTNHASAGAFGVPLVQLNLNDLDQNALHIATNGASAAGILMDLTTYAIGAGPAIHFQDDNDNSGNSGLDKDGASELRFEKINNSSLDDMALGYFTFFARNSSNASHRFARLKVEATDVTAGAEAGKFEFNVHLGGSSTELLSIGGEDTNAGVPASVVINEASANCDFRVESDGEDEAIFLDASANTLYINKGETAFETHIHNTNDVAMSVTSTGVVFNEDGHATNNFRVESNNLTVAFGVDAGDDTIAAGGNDSTNHKDGFAVFNDFNSTTFENKLADGQFGSGEVLRYSPGSSGSPAAGALYYLKTDGTWSKVAANNVANGATQLLGLGLGGNAQTVGMLMRGFMRISSGLVEGHPGNACDGLPIYASDNASGGLMTFTAPSSQNDFVRIVGYAIDNYDATGSDDDLLIYFNPDSTHVVIA